MEIKLKDLFSIILFILSHNNKTLNQLNIIFKYHDKNQIFEFGLKILYAIVYSYT